jgi:hypothetical protein
MSTTQDRTEPAPAAPEATDGRSRIFGFVSVAFVLGALVVLILALQVERVDLDAIDVPPLTLLEPREGAVVQGPIEFTFEVDGQFRPGPDGWGVGPLHIHMVQGRREYMPRFDDTRQVAPSRYVWTMPPFAEGEHTFRLVWATDTHGAIRDGASEPVTLRVVGSGAPPREHPQLHH